MVDIKLLNECEIQFPNHFCYQSIDGIYVQRTDVFCNNKNAFNKYKHILKWTILPIISLLILPFLFAIMFYNSNRSDIAYNTLIYILLISIALIILIVIVKTFTNKKKCITNWKKEFHAIQSPLHADSIKWK